MINRIWLTPTVGAEKGKWFDVQTGSCLYCESEHLVVEGDHTYHVRCSDCGTRGPRGDDVLDAITLWNTRPAEEALLKALKVVTEAYHETVIEDAAGDMALGVYGIEGATNDVIESARALLKEHGL